jgi:acetyl esterase/lipase
MVRATQVIVVLALALGPVAPSAPPGTDERDQGKPGMMTLEQLRREPVRFALDIPYAATDNPRQRLDLYLPKAPRAGKLPVIVFLHGGGWVQGDKADGAAPLMPFVRSGEYAGVSVGYRLSDEAVWPAQIHDCKAAIRWIRANADRYGLDPKRIAVWGRSAGAHLALMLGVAGDVPQLEGDLGPHGDRTSEVSGVVNFFGVTKIVHIASRYNDFDRDVPQTPEARLLGGPVRDNAKKARSASPITHVTPNDPPVLTIHGTADRTVPYVLAVRLDRALTRAGVPSYLIPVVGADHGDFPDEAMDRTADFLAKVLLGKDVDISTTALKKPRPDE